MPNITNPDFSSLFLTFQILPKGKDHFSKAPALL